MNLLEAIRAGDEFYRESWIDRRPITRAELGKLSKEALLADDWKVVTEGTECYGRFEESP